jgi:hypothetical protein
VLYDDGRLYASGPHMFALIAARPKIIAGGPSRVASAAEPDAAVATLASRGEMHMLLRLEAFPAGTDAHLSKPF